MFACKGAISFIRDPSECTCQATPSRRRQQCLPLRIEREVGSTLQSLKGESGAREWNIARNAQHENPHRQMQGLRPQVFPPRLAILSERPFLRRYRNAADL